ncbi:putative selenate reductase subunit YgfK [bacterium]|nr:putative selenate reductase subunit YgfK [candidate division CSSED10-310 bacterium]
MTEHLKLMPFPDLFKWIKAEYSSRQSIFSIPSQWFYRPAKTSICSSELYGRMLSTPIGPAAGPHTQLAQNIISAWLCGARYIELKTVQILDQLVIPRPCIDMTDEGYNVEWSQELRLAESTEVYIHAWVLIHLLPKLLDLPLDSCQTIFNISVGYNLEGLQSEPMRRFINTMKDASAQIDQIRHWLRNYFPEYADIQIPSQISNNVTLSTMHGCPPSEIQRIAEYLMRDCGLHTLVKLNPTLLGKERVLGILRDSLGYSYIDIPDSVFDADPSWDHALEMIRDLLQVADETGRHFGLKLSNTLAMSNHLGRLPGDEMYMSGRALFPVTVNLFARLQDTFDNTLNISYSAGADEMNLTDIIAAGANTVTVASDLLKPGGYGRLRASLARLETAVLNSGAGSLKEFQEGSLEKLKHLADDAPENPRYARSWFQHGLPKLTSALPRLDCIQAPCTMTCPAEQNPPAYIRKIVNGDLDAGLFSIMRQNPLPGMTGYVCPHTCQEKCTRNAYDQPVAIRHLKRYIRDNAAPLSQISGKKESRVAIVGSGPAGLSAAAFLAEEGVFSTIFEASAVAGGIPRLAPEFRIPEEVVKSDVERIKGLGVEIKLNHAVEMDPEELLRQGFDAVFLAPGFQKDIFPDIPGGQGAGVIGVLEFLAFAKQGECWDHARDIVVIGGGNAAMDAARTAARLTGHPVTVLYRRTRGEMPAWDEEISGLFEENNTLIELVSPVSVNREDGFPISVTCIRNELGDPGSDGRRRPIPIPGTEFDVPADLVIMAIGQKPDYPALSCVTGGGRGQIHVENATGATIVQSVYAGGDAVRGPSSIIEAIADGHRAARAILIELAQDSKTMVTASRNKISDMDALLRARIHRSPAEVPEQLAPDQRGGFDVIEQTYTQEQAIAEAGRCLQCDLICDRCVDVCPNRANVPIEIDPAVVRIPSIRIVNNRAEFTHDTTVVVSQNRQIIHIDDWCNACGNCSTFCTHSGEPFKEKIQFFIDEHAFESAMEDAWFARCGAIRRRLAGKQYSLSLDKGEFVCLIDGISVRITPAFQVISVVADQDTSDPISLAPVVEMMLLWKPLKDHPLFTESL